MIKKTYFWVLVGLLTAFVFSSVNSADQNGELLFSDLKRQTNQFMEWERTIRLTPEQESFKKAALTQIAAPCCADNSAYTCCCSCNISRTIWGLSNYLIARQSADVITVRTKVVEWIKFLNPTGYSGRACYTRGCAKAFKHDGCGGMRRDQVVF
jgi:hypothetical protein